MPEALSSFFLAVLSETEYRSDTSFMCMEKLLDYGIDLEKWEKEVDEMVEE